MFAGRVRIHAKITLRKWGMGVSLPNKGCSYEDGTVRFLWYFGTPYPEVNTGVHRTSGRRRDQLGMLSAQAGAVGFMFSVT